MILDIIAALDALQEKYSDDFEYGKVNAICEAKDAIRKIERQYHERMLSPFRQDRTVAEIVAATNVH